MKIGVKHIILIWGILIFSIHLKAQVGINNPNPDTSAVLDITSITQGLLIPRMTNLQRRSLANPANSLLVYDNTDRMLFFYDSLFTDANSRWTSLNPWKLRDDINNFNGTLFLRDIVTDQTVRSVSVGTDAINGNNNLNVANNVAIGTLTEEAPQNGAYIEGDVQANSNVTVTDTISASVVAGFGTVPLGGIIMWSGSVVPDGWQICDGTVIGVGSLTGNNTPNLSGRFIVGRGSVIANGTATYGVTGGGGTVGTGTTGGLNNVTLTVAQMPEHNHNITDPGHSHGFTDMHSVNNDGDNADDRTQSRITESESTTQSSTTNISINNSGGGQSHENRPPFYALAYIMRIR